MKTMIILILIFSQNVLAYTPNASKGFDAMDAEEQKEFDQVIDGLINEVCLYDVRIAAATNTINNEKEVQKVSGTSNLTRLNNAGQELVYSRRERQKRLDVYKNTMGEDLKKYECN